MGRTCESSFEAEWVYDTLKYVRVKWPRMPAIKRCSLTGGRSACSRRSRSCCSNASEMGPVLDEITFKDVDVLPVADVVDLAAARQQIRRRLVPE